MNEEMLTGILIILILIGLGTVIKWLIKFFKYIGDNLSQTPNPDKTHQKDRPDYYPSPSRNLKPDTRSEKEKYYESTYYKQTFQLYKNIINDKGKYGEYLIYDTLKHYEDTGARFLFNCYLKKTNGQTTEIDVIMIHNSAIFVFESKNYSGWIFGNENADQWTQTLSVGRGRPAGKEHFYNPIKQNQQHIYYLRKVVGDDIPIYSIIVFSDNCIFKEVNVSGTTACVIQLRQLNEIINAIIHYNYEYSNKFNTYQIYTTLYPFTQVTDQEKQRHVENIQNNHQI